MLVRVYDGVYEVDRINFYEGQTGGTYLLSALTLSGGRVELTDYARSYNNVESILNYVLEHKKDGVLDFRDFTQGELSFAWVSPFIVAIDNDIKIVPAYTGDYLWKDVKKKLTDTYGRDNIYSVHDDEYADRRGKFLNLHSCSTDSAKVYRFLNLLNSKYRKQLYDYFNHLGEELNLETPMEIGEVGLLYGE